MVGAGTMVGAASVRGAGAGVGVGAVVVALANPWRVLLRWALLPSSAATPLLHPRSHPMQRHASQDHRPRCQYNRKCLINKTYTKIFVSKHHRFIKKIQLCFCKFN